MAWLIVSLILSIRVRNDLLKTDLTTHWLFKMKNLESLAQQSYIQYPLVKLWKDLEIDLDSKESWARYLLLSRCFEEKLYLWQESHPWELFWTFAWEWWLGTLTSWNASTHPPSLNIARFSLQSSPCCSQFSFSLLGLYPYSSKLDIYLIYFEYISEFTVEGSRID